MADKITHDMTYVGFGDEKLPGQLKYATDAKWDADQPVAQADDWDRADSSAIEALTSTARW